MKRLLIFTSLLWLVVLGISLAWVAHSRREPARPVWIAFISWRDGQNDIYRMNPDGSDVVRLTYTPEIETGLAWSPDGGYLVYETYGNSASQNDHFLQILNIRSQKIRQELRATDDYRYPVWSPNRQWIVFVRSGTEADTLYRYAVADQKMTVLLRGHAYFSTPTFSPDGKWIAFTAQPYNAKYARLYKVRADGSDFQSVARMEESQLAPSWSPDGREIVYIGYQNNRFRLKVLDLAEEKTRWLRVPFGMISTPSWSPDGKWITFTVPNNGGFDIYRLRPDGSDLTQLTNTPAGELSPVWMPMVDRVWHPVTLALASVFCCTFVLYFSRKIFPAQATGI